MASLAQNVGEKPPHLPWMIKMRTFTEGGKISWASHVWKLFTNTLLASVAEKNIIIVPDNQVHHPQESQQASWRNTIDLIRFVALSRLNWPAPSSHTKNSFSPRYLVLKRIAPNIAMKYIALSKKVALVMHDAWSMFHSPQCVMGASLV